MEWNCGVVVGERRKWRERGDSPAEGGGGRRRATTRSELT